MKTIYYLYLSILSYLIPCILFGNLTIPTTIYLLISTTVLFFLIKYKQTQEKKILSYFYCILQGMSLGILGISIVGITQKGPILTVSIYFGTLIYFLSIISFIFLSSIYRNKKRQEYLKQFENNPISLQRDERINEILGINS